MADKTQKTIRIKWIRSGIGFPSRQSRVVRSLGLGRLNQVVERPDTPQIRGLVAKVPHLVTIVKGDSGALRPSVPEYTVLPPEVAPAEAPKVQEEPVPVESAASAEVEPGAISTEAPGAAIAEEKKKEKRAVKAAAAGEKEEEKPHRAAAKKSKAAKAEGKPRKAVKGEKGTSPKAAKPAKGGKK